MMHQFTPYRAQVMAIFVTLYTLSLFCPVTLLIDIDTEDHINVYRWLERNTFVARTCDFVLISFKHQIK